MRDDRKQISPGTDSMEEHSSSERSPHFERVEVIDLLRGLAMIFMALDHTRDYFTDLTFDPEDLARTWPFLFLVRWVTHFCAPAFFLLMGTGAFLDGRRVSSSNLPRFLITRGIWLIVLEFTVIGFAWTFQPGWGMFGVVWALGASMLLLACLKDLPIWVLLSISLFTVFGHDVFDRVDPARINGFSTLYSVLHRTGAIYVFGKQVFVLFPLVPWCAVTLLGFCLGPLFLKPLALRRRVLLSAGIVAILVFCVLRVTNVYGNPVPPIAHVSPGDFHVQTSIAKTVILFFDVEKYPPSLQFLLMTLGPALLLPSSTIRKPSAQLPRAIIVFGRTPLFFYLVHLYLIHSLAIVIAAVTNQPLHWLLNGAFFSQRGSTRVRSWPDLHLCNLDLCDCPTVSTLPAV